MAAVAAGFQRIVETPHDLNSLDVDWVFIIEAMLLVSRDEGKRVDVFVELDERKFESVNSAPGENWRIRALVWFKVVEGNAHEVGNDDVARNVLRSACGNQIWNVGERLRLGDIESGAAALVFNEEHSRPQEIDESIVA
jgi:hypothetical protein